ncbi:phosphomannomutase/phosphoglucomutase [Candidatus Sulfidibacterium hydrothermale]|uniref:phosphomannomutase/phosphoglucomutase n=1 Tax=Candidatus Sulfidibacterium hydrothermale TaxID=2875962 RepID=UPI001F0AAE88|nr:phosphomannomutase/phosphoglucomutase [Candidatus Sulfidibacterium hydrothermale]UBM62007.1 phosphomannomutase/phosphoglucomutase [Candidatus Sulfidibacterium hydrothermale]
MKAFKAYDIRGEYGKDLNKEMVYRIGYFLPQVLPMKEILIGRDVRLSSDEMFEALSEGLRDAGVDVADAGLTTTPMVYWGTGKYGFDASIMITASHNPKNHNGLKVSAKNVLPVGYDNGLKKLESLVDSDTKVEKKDKGQIRKLNMKPDYLEFLNQYKKDYSGLKLAIDFSNGMASLFSKDLFGDQYVALNEKADGTFPGHEPNPLEPENQEQIKEAVKKHHADLGIIFDGDADRVMFIDEKGNFISPDLIIALFAHFFLKDTTKKEKVVHDIRTSKAVGEYLSKFNAETVIWRVGRAYGATKLREVDGIYGGELAGHYYFRDFYYSDSGLLASLIMLNITDDFKKQGKTVSQLIHEISSYANTGEVNFRIEEKQKAMDAVVSYFKKQETPTAYYDFDGYRLEFPDWWFNIRPSNTEPYLRFLAEAKSQKLLDEKTQQVFEILKSFTA